MAVSTPQSTKCKQGEASLYHSFLCPIMHSLLIDPVMASDGFSYERSAIERWFRTSDTSPVTGLKVNRHLFPNHTLRSAIQEIYPEAVVEFEKRQIKHTNVVVVEDQQQVNGGSSSSSFDLTRLEIIEKTSQHFRTPPTVGSIYYGIFDQEFHRGDNLARSHWTVKIEFDSLQDYIQPPTYTAIVTWRKHLQEFEPSNLDDAPEDFRDFANHLRRTVGGIFTSKIRGTFDSSYGKLDMYSYESASVGHGFYNMLLGERGELLDGTFFLPEFVDRSIPSWNGKGSFRLRRYNPDG